VCGLRRAQTRVRAEFAASSWLPLLPRATRRQVLGFTRFTGTQVQIPTPEAARIYQYKSTNPDAFTSTKVQILTQRALAGSRDADGRAIFTGASKTQGGGGGGGEGADEGGEGNGEDDGGHPWSWVRDYQHLERPPSRQRCAPLFCKGAPLFCKGAHALSYYTLVAGGRIP
jgi:hypothetical protein